MGDVISNKVGGQGQGKRDGRIGDSGGDGGAD